MSVASELQKLVNIRSEIRQALINKGIDQSTANAANFEDFANLINQIQTA